jgi:serpin B
MILLFQACSDKSAEPPVTQPIPDRSLSQAEIELAGCSNAFGFKLFKKVVAAESEPNVFISPLSVSLALGMTLNGARGATYDSMQAALELAGMSIEKINKNYRGLIDFLSTLDPEVRFCIANSIWARLGFPVRQEFYQVNKTYFDAETRELDFSDPKSVDVINGWVDEKTNGKIDKIVEEIPDEIVMYLINAIYFNGVWTEIFDTLDTEKEAFLPLEGSPIQCDMMKKAETEVPYFGSEQLQAVELTYGNGDYSMILLLPPTGTSPDDLIGSLTDESWRDIVSSLTSTMIGVWIPRFKVEYETTLNEVLMALGMSIAFDDMRADLSGISNDTSFGNLYISQVKHKTYVEVDELGTEAAAVTVVEVGFTGFILPSNTFVADHPFAFVIMERKSGTILFMGKIEEPEFE